MRKHDKSKLIATFRAFTECARENQSVNMSKLSESLKYNLNSLSLFKKAVTHRFNVKEHGFNLDPIFKISKDGKINRLETPNNPKDQSIIDLIAKAMSYIHASENAERLERKTKFESNVSDKFLIDELSKRGYLIYKPVH